MVSPARRRDAIEYLLKRHRVSERRACRLLDQHRSTQRYRALPPAFELKLVRRMNRLAEQNPRYGYRRVWALLRSEGWAVNRKRIERLWRAEGHRVPPRRSTSGQAARGDAANASWVLPAVRPNHIWSYDFVSVRTRGGGQIRILNVVDEFTRVCVGAHVARSIGARAVTIRLEELFDRHGIPEMIRSDNGREFISQTVLDFLEEFGVHAVFIEKGSPQQNPFVERFNGTMRDELLNGERFDSVLEARMLVMDWIELYNHRRPHRGLGMMTPAAFATSWATGTEGGG
jgi:putative transposase